MNDSKLLSRQVIYFTYSNFTYIHLYNFQERFEAKFRQTQQPREVVKSVKRKFVGSLGAPPDDFRQLAVFPTHDDIDRQAVFLRPAKLAEKYESANEYLDIQFRLLREDLVRPLRNGINSYRREGLHGSDIFVYRNIELNESTFFERTGELITYAQLQV